MFCRSWSIATGSGKGDKASVAVAVSRLAPEVHLESSDPADAMVLALMGAQATGQRPQSKARAECLAKAVWPPSVREHLAANLSVPA